MILSRNDIHNGQGPSITSHHKHGIACVNISDAEETLAVAKRAEWIQAASWSVFLGQAGETARITW